jgi:hypothetical protein
MRTAMGYLIGRVSATHKRYGFIGISSVTKNDTSPHGLDTTADIYFHHDDVLDKTPPEVGDEVAFDVVSDTKRGREGSNFFRATKVMESEPWSLTRYVDAGVTLNIQGSGAGSNALDHTTPFLSWCLSPALAAKVREKMLDGKTVRLLLAWTAVGEYYNREQRRLVDLSDPMAMLGFRAPGLNRVFAFVVFGDNDSRLRDRYFVKESRSWTTDIISNEGDRIISSALSPADCIGAGILDVELPGELFAEKPRDWEWVNMFFKDPPVDQCAFRWRRAFAYPVQPVWMLILGICTAIGWLISILWLAALLSVGKKGINFEALRSFPKLPDLKWMMRDMYGSYFYPQVKGYYIPLVFAVSPLMIILAAAFAEVVVLGSGASQERWFSIFLTIERWVLGIFLVITLVSLGVQFALNYRVPLDVIERRQLERKSRLSAEADALVCDTTSPRKPNVWDLPPRPRNIRFYAGAAKQLVCRGFAAS